MRCGRKCIECLTLAAGGGRKARGSGVAPSRGRWGDVVRRWHGGRSAKCGAEMTIMTASSSLLARS